MLAQRWIPALLLLLLLVVQAQLWFGRGSVPGVAAMRSQLQLLSSNIREAEQRNEQLASEVRDLQEGLAMIEELARMELGMVQPNEVFVQIAQPRP